MLRKTLTISLLSLCTMYRGQGLTSNPPKAPESSFGIFAAGGFCLPVGVFGETSGEGGFAKPGYVLTGGISYKISSRVAMIAQYSHHNNEMDADFFAEYVSRGTPVKFSGESDSPWKMGNVYCGLAFRFNMKDKTELSFDLRAMGGMSYLTSPHIIVGTVHSQFGYTYIRQDADQTTAFGYLLGGTARFTISESAEILINGDYTGLASGAEFRNVKISSNLFPSYVDIMKQQINTFNLSAGILLYLD